MPEFGSQRQWFLFVSRAISIWSSVNESFAVSSDFGDSTVFRLTEVSPLFSNPLTKSSVTLLCEIYEFYSGMIIYSYWVKYCELLSIILVFRLEG